MKVGFALKQCAVWVGLALLSPWRGVEASPILEKVDFPKMVLFNYNFSITATLRWPAGSQHVPVKYEIWELENDNPKHLIHKDNFTTKESDDTLNIASKLKQGSFINVFKVSDLKISPNFYNTILLKIEGDSVKEKIHGMPGALTLVPIIVMLGVALLSSQATLALLLGVFISATFINGFNPLIGFLRTIDQYTINSLADPDHAKVIMFTFYLSASVALIQKSGGAEALALSVTKFATTRYRGQWATYLTGLVIFIDDPTSCLVVGANMRTVTDRLYLSHEKLAFLVHVMSSPITSLSPVSSWIGFVLGILAPVLSKMKSVESMEPFVFFLKTVPSRYFPIFAMILGAIAMATRRDFGPMLTAERRAFYDKVVVESDEATLDNQFEDPLAPLHEAPRRLINSILPIFTIIALTIISLLLSGYYTILNENLKVEHIEITLYTMAGKGNSYDALLYSSFFSCILCMFMYRLQGILSFSVGISTIMYGVKDMVEAMLILVFAWGVGTCFLEMGVDQFVVGALSGTLPSSLVPLLSFVLSAIVSFTTGTSWGTMAIMLPLAMPLGDASGKEELLVLTASAVMSGALFGDLCSPISVTTILTCSAVQLPVNKHVNSQLPYAILALVVAGLFGYLPVGLGLYPEWAAILIGTAVMVGCFYIFGVPTESTCTSRWETVQAYFRCSPKVADSSVTSSDEESDNAVNLKNVKL